MITNRTLKAFLIILITACFIITFSFIVSCRKAETVEVKDDLIEITETTEEETVSSVEEVEEAREDEVREEMEETGEEVVEDMEEEDISGALMIESPSFGENEKVPVKFTCDGDNINPRLDISGIPQATASLVLIVDDPDAPGGTWVHWTVWNIDPATTSISESSVPSGAVEGVTDFGVPGYEGPCPPSGTHRYFFKIFALDITLDLDPSSTASDVEAAIRGHVLGSAELIGLYGE